MGYEVEDVEPQIKVLVADHRKMIDAAFDKYAKEGWQLVGCPYEVTDYTSGTKGTWHQTIIRYM